MRAEAAEARAESVLAVAAAAAAAAAATAANSALPASLPCSAARAPGPYSYKMLAPFAVWWNAVQAQEFRSSTCAWVCAVRVSSVSRDATARGCWLCCYPVALGDQKCASYNSTIPQGSVCTSIILSDFKVG